MPLFARWRAERDLQRKADRYVERLVAEPGDDDVRWLAHAATRGDTDHARWELRYAKRALGLLTAERDALDDRTGSLVARALTAFAKVSQPSFFPASAEGGRFSGSDAVPNVSRSAAFASARYRASSSPPCTM